MLEYSRKNGIKPEFVNLPFNKWDYLYWRQSIFYKRLAENLTEGTKNKIPFLVAEIHQSINRKQPGKEIIPWPENIWRGKCGMCDQQAWLLCELAYQLGYETQIIYIFDATSGKSIHTLCEIRNHNQIWTADPFSGRLLPVAFSRIAQNPDLASSLWPERKDWQQAMQKAVLWTPAYPQDFCLRNRILFRELKSKSGDNCPRLRAIPY